MSASTQRSMLTFANLLHIAERAGDTPTLRGTGIQTVLSGNRDHIVVEVVFTDDRPPLPEMVDDADVVDLGDVRVVWFDRDTDTEWFLAAFPTDRDGVYLLVTTLAATNPLLKSVLGRIIGQRHVMRVFLGHDEFRLIGRRLGQRGDVAVSFRAAHSVLTGESQSNGWSAAIDRPSPEEAIADAESHGLAVKSLHLTIPGIATGYVRNGGGATFSSGDFRVFYDAVIPVLVGAAARRRSTLVRAPRQPRQPASAVTLTLNDPLFDSPERTGEVIEGIVDGLSGATIAVLHRNPYLHLVVTDEVDGSNYDLVVTEPDAINIYPGFLTTPAALTLVTNLLSDRFGAKSVTEMAPRRWSIEELTGD